MLLALGIVFLVGGAVLALLVAGVTLWSGWRATQDELRPGFKTSPPRSSGLVLTLIGVIVPILIIGAFTIWLSIVLLQLAVSAMSS
jgi:uncharacterized membrane protein YecN with MAPEG domain